MQNVQGPKPSRTQITLPQFKQLGAAARRGWRAATQLQRREAMPEEVLEVWVGLVVISSCRMASSRSERAVEAPCMGVPPAMEIFVGVFLLLVLVGPGVEVRETGLDCVLGLGFGLPRSETSVPWADGGGFDEDGCWGG